MFPIVRFSGSNSYLAYKSNEFNNPTEALYHTSLFILESPADLIINSATIEQSESLSI